MTAGHVSSVAESASSSVDLDAQASREAHGELIMTKRFAPVEIAGRRSIKLVVDPITTAISKIQVNALSGEHYPKRNGRGA
jgi:hypothetical protein